MNKLDFFFNHLMPYPGIPAGEDIESAWVTLLNARYDAEEGRRLYGEYLDQLVAAESLGYAMNARRPMFGDVRVRGEGDFFQDANDNTGAFPNFNAINTGQPFDISGTNFAPQLNVDQDRERFLRLGVHGIIAKPFDTKIARAVVASFMKARD